jgi:hypothetical protein
VEIDESNFFIMASDALASGLSAWLSVVADVVG